MNSIRESLKNLFKSFKSGETTEPPEIKSNINENTQPVPAETVATEPAPVPEPEPPQPAEPMMPLHRRVIQAPVISTGVEEKKSDAILIKAEPSATGDQCKFMVNRPLLAGHSWYFGSFESAEGSPLAEALFSIDDVETVLVHESTVTITRMDKTKPDWQGLGKEVGAAIRNLLQSGSELISKKIIDGIPSEQEIRDSIQRVIDIEVNPGVAGHGGNIALLDVQGNTVTIQMGGGCQGCSAADLTLKMGIHNSFRKSVPMVGAILDETDHSAGLNPYYS